MPKKLDTTPDGLICRVCGIDKQPYEFFKPRGRYNKDFFANGTPDGHTCFDCAGPYKCLGCGETKPSYHFRIQGRFCADCRSEGAIRNAATGSDSPSKTIEGLSI